MGGPVIMCTRCGSSRVNGRCDCPNGEIIDLMSCQYCGTHLPRAQRCGCREILHLPSPFSITKDTEA